MAKWVVRLWMVVMAPVFLFTGLLIGIEHGLKLFWEIFSAGWALGE